MIAAYLDELTRRLRARLGVGAERLSRAELEELAAALSHESLAVEAFLDRVDGLLSPRSGA